MTITISRPIEIEPKDLTREDIDTLDLIQAKSVITLLQDMLNESLAHCHSPEVEPPIDIEPQPMTDSSVTHSERLKGNHNRTGKTTSSTSKYHYVSYVKRNTAKKKWFAQITTSVNGKSKGLFGKSFKTEMEATLAVDAYLDSVNDNNRPRNRDEFPEVMEVYLLASQAPTL